MKTKTILLIEDDYLDVTSVKRALGRLDVKHTLHVASNGADALAILNGDSSAESKVLPDIILLDLNMPNMSGLEFLSIIKNYYSLKNIKIFVMTASTEEYDLVATQNLGVEGYILKPLDFENLKKSRYTEAVSNLKRALVGESTKAIFPVMTFGTSSSAGFKGKLVALKKTALAMLQHTVAVKVAAVSFTTFAVLGFAVKYKLAHRPAAAKVPAAKITVHSRVEAHPLLPGAPVEEAVLPVKLKKAAAPALKVPLAVKEDTLQQAHVVPAPKTFKIKVSKADDEEEIADETQKPLEAEPEVNTPQAEN